MTLLVRRARAAVPLALLALVLAGCGGAPVGPVLPGEHPGSAAPESARGRSESLVRLGDTALRSGEIETAASLFDQATQLDAANVGAALGLGDALLAAGRDLDASRAFERALAAQPDLPAAQYGYARAMIAVRRPEVAADFLHKLVAANPSDVASLNALGVSYDLMGQHDQASATYRQGLTVAPASVPLRNNLALSLALQNQFTEAVDLIRPVAEGPEATRRSRQNLALVYGLQGDLGAAARLGRADLDPGDLKNNLAYFATVRGLKSPRARAEALAPDQLAELDRLPPPLEARAARPAPPMKSIAPAAARTAPPPTPLPSATSGAPAAGPRQLTPGSGELGANPESAGGWFVDVGSFAESAALERWRALGAKHAAALSGLDKLAGAGTGLEPLLVGPLASEQAAAALCAQLGDDAATCRPVRL
ncbi:MAG: tetratricopeptide repeat protein [Geminicoccaceae bacterium]